MKKLLQSLEKAFYETKPILIIGIAVLVLVGTSWGISSLILSLMILGWAAAILFWRLEFRGSLKNIVRGKSKTPTPTSDSNSAPKDSQN